MPDFNTKNLKEYVFAVGNAKFTFFTDTGMIVEGGNTPAPLHSHEFHELFYVLRGNVTTRVQNNIFTFSGGDALLVPAGVLHETTTFENTQRIAISFFIEKDKKEKSSSQFSQFISVLKQGIVPLSDFIGDQAFKRLAHYYYSSYDDKSELIRACLHEIIVLIKASVKTDGTVSPSPIVFETSAYRNYVIDNYISSEFKTANLKDLSEKLHLSPQQTERLVKKLYGQSFREYLNFFKMRYAADLLLNTQMTSAEISSELGYSYPHSFLTAFKKQYGKTPLAYRKENSKNATLHQKRSFQDGYAHKYTEII